MGLRYVVLFLKFISQIHAKVNIYVFIVVTLAQIADLFPRQQKARLV